MRAGTMRPWPRLILGSCSVAIIAVVAVTAAALGPEAAQPWLLLSAGVAVITAVQGAASDPGDLAPALLFGLPPVIGLLADGSPTWLIGPLAVLLLVAGELNALAWESRGSGPLSTMRRHRLRSVGQLAAVGLVASLLVWMVGQGPAPRGTVAAVVAGVALAALGGVVFRRSA